MNTLEITTKPPLTYEPMLATGLTPMQIVRKKYPKAWSQGHPIINPQVFTIRSGKYDHKSAYPSFGDVIGRGKTLKQAWKNAAQACC